MQNSLPSKTLFLKEIRTLLEKHGDPERSKQEKRYLYSDLEHYGITAPKGKKLFAPYKKQLKGLTKKEALELARLFWKQPSHDERNFALNIINIHKEKLDSTDLSWIEDWMRECKGWALLDNFIIPVMPKIIKKDRGSAEAVLKKWIKDDDFWVRRSALLAQLLLFRTGKGGNKKLFFDLAESQFDESWIDEKYPKGEPRKRARFFIRKAIGWTLREMSKRDPESVVAFLKKNKTKMSGLSFRESSRKLPEKWKRKL